MFFSEAALLAQEVKFTLFCSSLKAAFQRLTSKVFDPFKNGWLQLSFLVTNKNLTTNKIETRKKTEKVSMLKKKGFSSACEIEVTKDMQAPK